MNLLVFESSKDNFYNWGMISVSTVIPFGILGATSVAEPLLGMVTHGASVLLSVI